MKHLFTIALSFALIFGLSSFVTEITEEGHESSSIVWTGTKVTGSHTGTVDFKSFDWKFDEAGTLVSANFFVDMTSIQCTDLDEETGAKLEGHLKSTDFFNTEAYPTASFQTSTVESLGKGKYTITGELKIKSTVKSVSFEATVTSDGHITTAIATVVINRTAYDIKYGSGSFFDGLGDKMISDEFALDIEIKKH
jgi:polyisoprenoid-binding protein YceI